MELIDGINHIAIVTQDLERFVEFYAGVFELQLLFEEQTPAFRHAILRTGARSWLHPVQLATSEHAAALPRMFERGHLDHLSLGAASPEAFQRARGRLLARRACDELIEDLGVMHSLWFEDPDGMRAELCLIVDQRLRGFHAPVATIPCGSVRT